MIADKIKHFESKVDAIVEAHNHLEKLKAEYKAELKAEFGITDGEPADILSLIRAIHKVVSSG